MVINKVELSVLGTDDPREKAGDPRDGGGVGAGDSDKVGGQERQ